ncbi:hypothetical protein B0H13DRAFT_2332977 [Mycena leptocephala]|nr:hypothetical protein B0H13DRAFT_2332977 [Mycena leptocephala]
MLLLLLVLVLMLLPCDSDVPRASPPTSTLPPSSPSSLLLVSLYPSASPDILAACLASLIASFPRHLHPHLPPVSLTLQIFASIVQGPALRFTSRKRPGNRINWAADYELYLTYLTTGLKKRKASVLKIFRVWDDIFFPGRSDASARAEDNGSSTVDAMDLLNADAEEGPEDGGEDG